MPNLGSVSGSRRLLLGVALTLVAPSRGAAQRVELPTVRRESVVSRTAPLTLPDVLARAAAEHPLLAAARARTQTALGARRAVGVLPNPVLASQVENVRLPGGAPVGMDRETMATATFPLEFLYQRGARVRQADAALQAVEADALGTRQRLALEAARGYYRVALGQVEVATARDLAVWLDSLVAYNQTRVREGAAAEADLVRSQLERDRAWADVTMQEVELARARAELATFLGDSVRAIAERGDLTVVTPDDPLVIPTATTESSAAAPAGTSMHDTFPSHAIAGRPELRAARARLTAATAGVGAARSLFVRELGAMAGLKWAGGATSFVMGLSLPFPLFNQNGGEIAMARAERDVAMAELAVTERAVAADLAGAEAGARLLSERTAALAYGRPDERRPGEVMSYLARADEARRITLGAYREGAVPLLQVLDAARAWGESRMAYYRTLYAQHESVIALLAAQGRDLFRAIPSLTTQTTNAGNTAPGTDQ